MIRYSNSLFTYLEMFERRLYHERLYRPPVAPRRTGEVDEEPVKAMRTSTPTFESVEVRRPEETYLTSVQDQVDEVTKGIAVSNGATWHRGYDARGCSWPYYERNKNTTNGTRSNQAFCSQDTPPHEGVNANLLSHGRRIVVLILF